MKSFFSAWKKYLVTSTPFFVLVAVVALLSSSEDPFPITLFSISIVALIILVSGHLKLETTRRIEKILERDANPAQAFKKETRSLSGTETNKLYLPLSWVSILLFIAGISSLFFSPKLIALIPLGGWLMLFSSIRGNIYNRRITVSLKKFFILNNLLLSIGLLLFILFFFIKANTILVLGIVSLCAALFLLGLTPFIIWWSMLFRG